MIPEAFFDWTFLATYAGATLAVVVITQFTKDLPGIKAIPTKAFAYIVAAVILLLATIFTVQEVTAQTILLCLINAVLVAMAAVGGYEIVSK